MATSPAAALAAFTLFWTTAPVAQDPPPRDPDGALAAAALAADVRGDPRAAIAALRAALADTPADRRPALLARLAILCRRVGELEAADSALAEMEGAAEPWRSWAAGQRRNGVRTGQDPRDDPFVTLLIRLDSGSAHGGDSEDATTAFNALKSLGVLAYPPIVAAMPELGPFGVRNALVLLREAPESMAAPALELLLADERLERQAVAAAQLRSAEQLSPAAAERLARLALVSRYPLVRLEGARALGVRDATHAGGIAELERLLAEPEVAHEAFEAILRQLEPDDETLALALAERLDPERRRRLLAAAVTNPKWSWPALHAQALSDPAIAHATVRRIVHDLTPDPLREVAMLARHAPDVLREHSAELVPPRLVGIWEYLAQHGDGRTARAVAREFAHLDLGDFDPDDPAFRILSDCSDPSNLDDLLALVALPMSNQPQLRHAPRAVGAALRRWLDREHLAPALARLHELHGDVAAQVLRIAGRIATPSELPAVDAVLRRALADRGEEPVGPESTAVWAIDAIEAAGARGVDGAAELLLPLLGHDDWTVVDRAFGALQRCPSVTPRRLAAAALDAGGDWTLERVLWLRAAAVDAALRDRALAAAARDRDLDAEALEPFFAAIPDATRQATALRVLQENGDPPPAPGILIAAMRAAAVPRDAGLVPTLAELLAHPDESVRLAAVAALRDTFAGKAAVVLLDALDDRSEDVRLEAESAIQVLADHFETRSRLEALIESTIPAAERK